MIRFLRSGGQGVIFLSIGGLIWNPHVLFSLITAFVRLQTRSNSAGTCTNPWGVSLKQQRNRSLSYRQCERVMNNAFFSREKYLALSLMRDIGDSAVKPPSGVLTKTRGTNCTAHDTPSALNGTSSRKKTVCASANRSLGSALVMAHWGHTRQPTSLSLRTSRNLLSRTPEKNGD